MIKSEHLTKKFGDYFALNDISCEIQSGCVYGMVGSNGAGKSTFLRAITGIYRADGGIVTLDGENVFENTKVKSKIAFVPDELYFLPGASMDRMSKMYKSVFESFDEGQFREYAKLLNLDTKMPIGRFSKGMKRQAATILALARNTEYIFFDETFDGLDPVVRSLIKKLICDRVVEKNATAIITSHSLRELEDTCDQLALLHKGGLVFESEISNLKTSLFKAQVAFLEPYDQSKFRGLDIMHYSQKGSVANIIIKGNREQAIALLNSMNPVLMDILPLSLEEVFTYEMAMLGYTFDEVFDSKEKAGEAV